MGRLMRSDVLAGLPGTVREAESLAALAGPDLRVNLRTGPKASRQFVQRGGLTDYSILHFATHGLLDLNYPALSALLLADEQADGPAFLKAGDIAALDFDAELVVLSGCETGAGRIRAGEGALSLARPFLIAGADQVVSTLWKVDDARTADFMASFYRHLLEGDATAAGALAAAQREMRDDPATDHPFYWAGFTLAGTALDS
jgi:CHAT domain-containing protein